MSRLQLDVRPPKRRPADGGRGRPDAAATTISPRRSAGAGNASGSGLKSVLRAEGRRGAEPRATSADQGDGVLAEERLRARVARRYWPRSRLRVAPRGEQDRVRSSGYV